MHDANKRLIDRNHGMYAGQDEDPGIGNPSDSSFSAGTLLVGFLATVLIVGAIALGVTAFGILISQDDAVISNAFHFCTPPGVGITLFQNPQDESAVQNRSSVVIERIGDRVHVQIVGFSNLTQITFGDPFFPDLTFVGIDARCVPPILDSILCPDPCPSPEPPEGGANLFADGDEIAFRTAYVTLAQSLCTGGKCLNNPYFVSDIPFAVQGELDEILYYGVTTDIVAMIPGDFTYPLHTIQVDLYYDTRVTTEWEVPDFCTGGPCTPGLFG